MVAVRWSMMSGCTSGGRVAMPGCGKGRLPVGSFVGPVAQLQEQFPRQCKVGSPDHQSHRQLADGVPLTHCVMCGGDPATSGKSVFQPRCVPPSGNGNAAEWHLCLRPGMLSELNLNFCGTTNVNEPKRPRPVILMRCCRTPAAGYQPAPRPWIAMRKGTRYAAVLLMSSACNMS